MPYKHKRLMHRKRQRGLCRHGRNHQQRAAMPQTLSLSLLESARGNTEQLGIAPWTVHGKPPRAIRQLWVNRLLADFFDWQRQLTALYPDFWLSIRLYDPRFGLAQLDAAIHEQQAYFERNFHNEGVDIPLPPEYQSLLGAAQLRWTCYPVLDGLRLDEFTEHYAWYKKKPYWTDQDATGEDCVLVQTGYVWVGQAAT
jgi:hypothetical protein